MEKRLQKPLTFCCQCGDDSGSPQDCSWRYSLDSLQPISLGLSDDGSDIRSGCFALPLLTCLPDFPVLATRYRRLTPLHSIGAKPLKWGLCVHTLYRVGRTGSLNLGQRGSPTSASSCHLREITSANSTPLGYLSEALSYKLCSYFTQKRIAPSNRNHSVDGSGGN
jgi:hypothetical protein